MYKDFRELEEKIVNCKLCPRLVKYREEVAKKKVRRFRDWDYWGKPVPGFGDPNARILIVGLAPAAHGANRTGRMFTGDSSGDWLFKALYETGFANKAESIHRNDGLMVKDIYISALIRCVPPKNKPSRDEILNCRRYLKAELKLLKNLQIVICLGRLSWKNTLETLYEMGYIPVKNLDFSHGAQYLFRNIILIASYHPSRQNTQTGRLKWDMWIDIFKKAREYLDSIL